MTEKDRKYIERKKREIEGYIAVATGAASMISIMEGRCTDAVIKSRDEMTERSLKCVDQIMKRFAPTKTDKPTNNTSDK